MKQLLLTLLGLSLSWSSSFSAVASPLQPPEALQGQDYSSLPKGFCQGYSESILGTVNGTEYSALICERQQVFDHHQEVTYILLQKLRGYTTAGKAIWQVVRVKKVPDSPEEFVTSLGCSYEKQDNNLVFALVNSTVSQPSLILQAWQANLSTEQFQPVDPARVICENPWYSAGQTHQECSIMETARVKVLEP